MPIKLEVHDVPRTLAPAVLAVVCDLWGVLMKVMCGEVCGLQNKIRGLLRVTVVEAKGLPAMDLFRGMTKASAKYVYIHAHTNTHSHIHTCIRTHTRTHTYAHAHAYAHM